VTPRLLLKHGWAFDHTIWRRVLRELGRDGFGAVALDAGYYGPPITAPEIDGPVLGVGHSLGALELLADPPPRLVGVVAINGFACFGRTPSFPEGMPQRVLARMRRDAGSGGVADFLEDANAPPPDGAAIDVERIREGLDRLATLDGRSDKTLPIWRLHCEDDDIAPLSLADASFAGLNVVERRLRPWGGHFTPVDHPKACVGIIRAALKALA
jgi:pimeloyl-[acyl-carrier protein] methyl ester esterase